MVRAVAVWCDKNNPLSCCEPEPGSRPANGSNRTAPLIRRGETIDSARFSIALTSSLFLPLSSFSLWVSLLLVAVTALIWCAQISRLTLPIDITQPIVEVTP